MKTLLFSLLSAISFSLFAQQQVGTDTILMNVTVAQAKTIVDTNIANPDFIILDIRTPSEFATSHIANATNVNYNDPNFSSLLDALDHNKKYLLHCWGGSRSTPTFATMQAKHFREVYHMNNGFGAWYNAGYPYVTGYTFAENANASESIKLYTNTSNNYLNVFSNTDQPARLSVVNMQGQLVMEVKLTPGNQQFVLSHLATGVYVVNIQSADEWFSEKIFVH
jgi:rhodanese-related sulfurtransferase